MSLSANQIQNYEEQGFLVVYDLVPPEELAALLQRLDNYAYERRPAGNVRIQIEPRVAGGEIEAVDKGAAIRKMEGLVENDDLFQALGLRITAALG